MIARIWRGITSIKNADQYLEYLNQVVLPGYVAVEGNQGVFILRDDRGELVYFLLLSIWSSQAALTRFTGPDLEIDGQVQEGQKYLVAAESVVNHYEVVASIHPTIAAALCPKP